MGLDMYLYKGKHIYNYDDDGNGSIGYQEKWDKPMETRAVKFEFADLFEQVGYWRKANSIHKWFVDNVQGGIDDCKRYEVSWEKLMELKGLCEQVLKDHSKKEQLPTQPGFCFGNTDYGDDYYADLQTTIDIINTLKQPDNSTKYYYSSSW